MSTAWARVSGAWERFWFTEVDGRPLGLARMGIAVAGLVHWAGSVPTVRQFYSDEGAFPIAAARDWSRELVAQYLMPDFMGAYPMAALVFAAWGVALVMLLLGWKTRAAAWANWILFLWVYYRNATFNNGGDEVLRLTSMYLALAYAFIPARHRAYSLDRRRWLQGGGAAGPTRIPAWPIRMIQIQIAVVYVVAGFWKVVGMPWHDGTALYYALGNESFTRFGVPEWRWLRIPFTALTLAVAWWEFLFPALMAWRRTRIPALGFGVAIHAGILLFMSIGIFPFVMLGCYPVFLTGEEVGRLVRPFTGSPRQPRAARTASTASGVSS